MLLFLVPCFQKRPKVVSSGCIAVHIDPAGGSGCRTLSSGTRRSGGSTPFSPPTCTSASSQTGRFSTGTNQRLSLKEFTREVLFMLTGVRWQYPCLSDRLLRDAPRTLPLRHPVLPPLPRQLWVQWCLVRIIDTLLIEFWALSIFYLVVNNYLV